MEFRDLKKQYQYLKKDIDQGIAGVIEQTAFIQGKQVRELEEKLADYVGVKHCVSCGNGTDALQLALMAWNVGAGDAVFVPDFTFFSSGEVVSCVGAVPIFVDVDDRTYNVNCEHLEHMICKTLEEGRLTPKAIVAVDLFGQPAEFEKIRAIADKYKLKILEDAAQGFGGRIGQQKACSFGDIGTTSFFPAKPLGCYGDGGAVFTDNDEWAELLRSYRVHGKGSSKYDNIRIGMNSRLDTMQAAVLLAKLPVFTGKELEEEQKVAVWYTEGLKDIVKTPVILENFYSSWAQYTIQLPDGETRDRLQAHLKGQGIPSMVYYQKPMHRQQAFTAQKYDDREYSVTNRLSETVLSLPFHPYMEREEVQKVIEIIREFMESL